MKIAGQKDALILLLGDILALVLAVGATLIVRYGEWPSADNFLNHLVPFSYIFAIWLLVFFIADLYRRHTSLFESQLPSRLFNAQLANSAIAVTFFYLIPYFNITPKITLFICLVLSFVFILVWRRFLAQSIIINRRERVVFACVGSLVAEIASELRRNKQYNITVITGRDPDPIQDRGALIVFDQTQVASGGLPGGFYRFLLAGCRFVTATELYEQIFDRIPVELVQEAWLVENVSSQPKPIYNFIKRAFDLIVSLTLGVLSLPLYPLIYLGVKISDGGPLFFVDQRVGRKGKVFSIYKFRSMNLAGDRVTRFGRLLRKTRLDELPQLWSVLRGQQSLVGPRPERPPYVDQYREEIPFYDIRHLIAPGLSGWAQIYHDNHPHFRPMKEATMEKLSYDLFYIKNRSIWLDLTIALRTIATILSVKGK
jgi:lipopolysaccharide/colanic/teichoic acid biosynthesis glycosyltransferase